MMDVLKLDIKDLLDSYQKKQAKPSEVVKSYLASAKENAPLGAFLELREDETLKRAETLDGKMADAGKLPLFGIPIAIKDNILVKGWQATAGSKILEGFTS